MSVFNGVFACTGFNIILQYLAWLHFRDMAFNTTFNNISAIAQRSVLLLEENGVPGENHRPVASYWQT